MPRKIRISIPGRFYHVLLRGNNSENIFFSNEDRCRLSLLLQEGVERFGHKIHAFCFMSNHIHLAVQTSQESISKVVQNFAFRYSSYINRRYSRKGHVFQGRFKSILLNENGFLKRLIRYIHLNPLRVGLVKNALSYRWSSYSCYLNPDEHDFPWVTTHVVLNKFGEDYDTAIKEFISYHSHYDEDDAKLFRSGNFGGIILGDQGFIDEIRNNALGSKELGEVENSKTLKHLIEIACRKFSITPEELATDSSHNISRIRALLAVVTSRHPSWTLKELAKELNRESCTLSNLVRRYQKHKKMEHSFSKELKELERSLLE